MPRIIVGLSLFSLIVGSLLIMGCRADTSGLSTVTVSELAGWINQDSSVVVCDANGEDTRERYGVIPGALLLSSHKDYDVAGELPQERDRKLVFYCSSEACSAAPAAARRAVAGGFTDVYVLPAGIKGWVNGEQPVQKLQAG